MNISSMKNKNLKAEANYFIKFFFNKKVDDKTIERYICANKKVFVDDDKFEQQNLLVENIVAYNADIEAIEFAWRIRDKDNILSKKIQIIFYILEARSDYVSFFVNRKNAFAKAMLVIFFSFIRSIYKLLKGRILLRRYHIV